MARVIIDQGGPNGEMRSYCAGEKVEKFYPVHAIIKGQDVRVWYSKRVLDVLIKSGKVKPQ